MVLDIRWMLYIALLVTSAVAERWQFPDEAESVRIDTKVRFIDTPKKDTNIRVQDEVQADEVPFQEATDTEGFYNRPAGSGRFPVRVEENLDDTFRSGPKRNRDQPIGSSNSFLYCKCSPTPDCAVIKDNENRCGSNQYLCCYNQPTKQRLSNSEIFNEIEDERLIRYPGQGNVRGPFPQPFVDSQGVFAPGYGQENVLLGPLKNRGPSIPSNTKVLVGPNGPTGIIGPNKPVLVGPEGPTGIVGPAGNRQAFFSSNPDVTQSETAQRGVLVGPGFNRGNRYNRPVLVGPGGPTGIIGPRRQQVLVGPGGPTGIIGPNYGRQNGPGILVGPGGPTGIIGPGRQILTGPGGPTGIIGPRGNF